MEGKEASVATTFKEVVGRIFTGKGISKET
jgi:hypothetical protein